MGSDAEIYVFDYDRFTRAVVPAIGGVLAGRGIPEWLAALAEQQWDPIDVSSLAERGRDAPVELSAVCHVLNDDLGVRTANPSVWTLPADGERYDSFWSEDWADRACTSTECPARSACVLHRTRGPDKAETLNMLFELGVRTCLGPSQFVGRTMNVSHYRDILAPLKTYDAQEARRLLTHLGVRGHLLGYSFGNSDGIHGWLTPDETTDLLGHLETLDLPTITDGLDGMNRFRSADGKYQPPAGYTFEALSLAFVRTVAAIAVSDRRGLLWGNDIIHLD